MTASPARYAMSRTVPLGQEEADRRVRDELRNEGFGILTEIDVSATLKAKMGVELPPYVILGACNPPLAHAAIEMEPDVGLLLPCNVVVRAAPNDGGTIVEALDPVIQLEIANNPRLRALAGDVRARLERAIARVAGGS